VVVVVVAVMVCRDYLIISLRQMKDCRNKLWDEEENLKWLKFWTGQ
jgi:hypothetical protein